MIYHHTTNTPHTAIAIVVLSKNRTICTINFNVSINLFCVVYFKFNWWQVTLIITDLLILTRWTNSSICLNVTSCLWYKVLVSEVIIVTTTSDKSSNGCLRDSLDCAYQSWTRATVNKLFRVSYQGRSHLFYIFIEKSYQWFIATTNFTVYKLVIIGFL